MSHLTTITITTDCGPQDVPAYVFGIWAVHRRHSHQGEPRRGTWRLTHVRSGIIACGRWFSMTAKPPWLKFAKACDRLTPDHPGVEGARPSVDILAPFLTAAAEESGFPYLQLAVTRHMRKMEEREA